MTFDNFRSMSNVSNNNFFFYIFKKRSSDLGSFGLVWPKWADKSTTGYDLLHFKSYIKIL